MWVLSWAIDTQEYETTWKYWRKITSGKYGENLQRQENVEVVLVHWDIVTNKYQRDSWVLSAFVPNKTFGELLNISPTFV